MMSIFIRNMRIHPNKNKIEVHDAIQENNTI